MTPGNPSPEAAAKAAEAVERMRRAREAKAPQPSGPAPATPARPLPARNAPVTVKQADCDKAMETLRRELSEDGKEGEWLSWAGQCALAAGDDGCARLSAPTRYVRDETLKRYGERIEAALPDGCRVTDGAIIRDAAPARREDSAAADESADRTGRAAPALVAELLGPTMRTGRTWNDLSPAEQAALNADTLALVQAGIAEWRDEFRREGERLIGAIQGGANARFEAGQPREVMPYRPARASLPRFQRLGEAQLELPGFPQVEAPQQPEQMALPGFEPPVSDHWVSWLLWLYDRAGGNSMTAGRGAPWDMHLFVGAFLHLEIADRDGEWHRMRFPHLRRHAEGWPDRGRKSIEEWLFPDGWSHASRDWERLAAALHRMKGELAYVPVPGLGSVAMVFPSVIPEGPDDPLVEFTVRVPEAAAHGARIDWPRLQDYRMHSGTLYRAYLSAAAFMDKTAHRGHGITREIAAPILDGDGKPMRRKGGAIRRDPSRREANRQARFVRSMSDGELAAAIGLDPTKRKHRFNTRQAFERLDADGVIDLENEGRRFRIFAPGG